MKPHLYAFHIIMTHLSGTVDSQRKYNINLHLMFPRVDVRNGKLWYTILCDNVRKQTQLKRSLNQYPLRSTEIQIPQNL